MIIGVFWFCYELGINGKILNPLRNLPSTILFPVPLKSLHPCETELLWPVLRVRLCTSQRAPSNKELSSLFIMKPSIDKAWLPTMSLPAQENGDLRRSMPRCLSDTRFDEALSAHGQSGHRFVCTTFTRPTCCNHCTDMLRGFTNQGLICEGFNYNISLVT